MREVLRGFNFSPPRDLLYKVYVLTGTRMRDGIAFLVWMLALVLGLAGSAAKAGGPEPVEFRDGDLSLKAMLYQPDGAAPFPAVIAMHDCAGLTNTAGAVAIKYREWAQALVKDGFMVLFPDSCGSRPSATNVPAVTARCGRITSVSRMPTRRGGGSNSAATFGATIFH